jgi:glyoxylase-like metal-dependent hydrolase (beta-lactamase superfamily II)
MGLVVERFEIMANCYVVRADDTAREAVVVDPGGEAAALSGELARRGLTCAAILVTHADVDHVGGVAELAELTGAPVYAPDPALMPEVRAQGGGFFPPPRPYEIATTVADGTAFDAAAMAFEAIAVPGHSPDHVAYLAEGTLFAGDLLMAGTVGRVDFPGGDWDALLASVAALFERLPAATVVYPGHGGPTTLGAEQDAKRGVTNLITVLTQPVPTDIRERIVETLRRSADLDADHITVDVEGSKAILRGTVRSYTEFKVAERAARDAPGITEVENRLTIEPGAYSGV